VPDRERLDVDRDTVGGIPTRVGLNLTVADEVVTGGAAGTS
jgi:hypothetical protein